MNIQFLIWGTVCFIGGFLVSSIMWRERIALIHATLESIILDIKKSQGDIPPSLK